MRWVQLSEAHHSLIAELEPHDFLILTTIPKRQCHLPVNLKAVGETCVKQTALRLVVDSGQETNWDGQRSAGKGLDRNC